MTSSRPRDNRDRLIRTAVAGRIAPARLAIEGLAVDHGGRQVRLPGTGGIALGVHAGDPVDRWLSDHLMPGASIEDLDTDPAVAGPLHLLSCVGNTVRNAVGRPIGIVAGKRGGLAPGFWAPQLVGVEISDAEAERHAPGDRVVVEAEGRGLAFLDHPDVLIANLAPRALDALPLQMDGAGLACSVVAVIPAEAAGAGLGQDSWIGDLEIAAAQVNAGTLERLRYGDLVAFSDLDARTTRFYSPGCISIGIVSHGPSPAPGHGVGVTIILTGPDARLRAEVRHSEGLGGILSNWAEEC